MTGVRLLCINDVSRRGARGELGAGDSPLRRCWRVSIGGSPDGQPDRAHESVRAVPWVNLGPVSA